MSRPRIACFHGGGSNSAIYNIQCSRLEGLLSDVFEFVYFEAPFDCGAGPGILPFFADYMPFKTWFKRDEKGAEVAGDGSGFDSLGTDGIDRVLSLMREKGKGGEWVAVMGFSQGTRVAGGLLLDQQLKAAAGIPGELDLKFGVLCMGSRAPMISSVLKSAQGKEDGMEVTHIAIPTLHLHGLRDGNLEPGRQQLATHFDQKTSTLMEIDYHHAMPWNKADLPNFADMLRQMLKNTQDRV